MTHKTPSPQVLRELREMLGLSQAELAKELGFAPASGERLVRRWEEDPDFRPTPLAWLALHFMLTTVLTLAKSESEGPRHAIEFLRSRTPEALLKSVET